MGLMDDMKNKAEGIMNDPDKKAKIEQFAKDKGISIEEAKNKLFGKKNKDNR